MCIVHTNEEAYEISNLANVYITECYLASKDGIYYYRKL